MVPLTTAALLSHVIVGSALEQMDMERLINEVGLAVAERVHGGQESVDDVARGKSILWRTKRGSSND